MVHRTEHRASECREWNGYRSFELKAAIENGRANRLNGAGPFRYGILSRKFVASMEPPVVRKSKGPASYAPPAAVDLRKTVDEYRRIALTIRALAASASDLDLARVKTKMPALPALLRPFITMPLGARLELIAAHDRRHLWQAEELMKQL